jgi:hypothetical protein
MWCVIARASWQSVGWVSATQVGFTRSAHLLMPISGKPEIGGA